jgi:hypothetical protein
LDRRKACLSRPALTLVKAPAAFAHYVGKSMRIVRRRNIVACPQKEMIMRRHFPFVLLAIVSPGSGGTAAAQGTQERALGAAASQQGKLTEEDGRAVARSLQDQPSQTLPPGTEVEIGKKVPVILKLTPMPPEIFAIWPEARDVLYVRLPDRVVLFDPETQTGSQIILDSETTGGPSGSSSK